MLKHFYGTGTGPELSNHNNTVDFMLEFAAKLREKANFS